MILKQINVTPIDLPVEYNKMSLSDFAPDYKITGNKVNNIVLDESGFIDPCNLDEIDFNQRNTVVINAGVGEGKSSLAIQIANKFYSTRNSNSSQKYLTVFVVPFKSLIHQYKSKLINSRIEYDKIFSYLDIQTSIEKEIQVPEILLISANTLLGNYGDNAFIQSRAKRDYLNEIIRICTIKKIKVNFIFDEIHECVSSFQKKFIYNLWKWFHIKHKIFILSATFTESSKIIIKYLAQMTKDEIQIFESKRKINENRQCRLNIFFNNSYTYSGDDLGLKFLVQQEIEKNKKIHILCFSETLADDIAKPKNTKKAEKITYSEVGELLLKEYKGINICTGSSQTAFDETKCNVGTNFKTGISIENENSTLIIIAPPISSYQDVNNRYFGIFTEGSNSIIQAIARMRNTSNTDVFLMCPNTPTLIAPHKDLPIKSNYLYLFNKYEHLKYVKSKSKLSDYYSINQQYSLIKKMHRSTYNVVQEGIKAYTALNVMYRPLKLNMPRLDFPLLDDYLLEDGDRYLYSFYPSFGSNISSYIVWASFNNQFSNAKLSSIIYEDEIVIQQSRIVDDLLDIHYKHFHKKGLGRVYSQKRLFDEFKKYLIEVLKVKIWGLKKGVKVVIPLEDNKFFLKALATAVNLILNPNGKLIQLLHPNGQCYHDTMKNKVMTNYFIDKKQYFIGNIDLVSRLDDNFINVNLTESERRIVSIYKEFNKLLNLFKSKVLFKDESGRMYIPKKEVIIEKKYLGNGFLIASKNVFKELKKYDEFIYNEEFSFCQWLFKKNTETERLSLAEKRKMELGKIIDEFRNLFFESNLISISNNTILKNSFNQVLQLTNQPYLIEKELTHNDNLMINLLFDDYLYKYEKGTFELLQDYYTWQIVAIL